MSMVGFEPYSAAAMSAYADHCVVSVCAQNKEHVAKAVKEELTKAMTGFGYEIIQACPLLLAVIPFVVSVAVVVIAGAS